MWRLPLLGSVWLVASLWVLGMDWMDPTWLLDRFSGEFFWICAAIIFIECGLLFPFLPGDTLLFAIGLFIATGKVDMVPGHRLVELAFALFVMTAAAFLGNAAGYEIGRAIGPPIYERDGRFLKRKYFDQTREFFETRGRTAIIAGRFFAYVRTFVTVVAGATRMSRHTYYSLSLIGAVAWVFLLTLLGYFLGRVWPDLGDNIELAVIVIGVVFAIPLAWEIVRARMRRPKAPQ